MKKIKKKILLSAISLSFILSACNFGIINNTQPLNQSIQNENSNDIFDTTFNIKSTVATPNPDWMEQMQDSIANKPLRNIVFPGTHDSGTHLISENSDFASDNTLDTILASLQSIKDKLDKLFKNKKTTYTFRKFISAWSKAQSLSIYDQLQLGIRYLDIRTYRKNDGQMYIVHGMYSQPLDNVINDVKRFTNEHPKEIILMDFNHLYNMKGHHEELVKKLNDAFTDSSGKSKIVPGSSTVNVTPGELWKNQTQIIALYDDQDTVNKHPELWSQKSIFSPWANKQNINQLKGTLQSILDGNLFNNTKNNFDCKKASDCEKVSNDKFFVLQGIQTPDAKMLVENLSLFYSLKNDEEDYNKSATALNNINKKYDDFKKKYNEASFFIKPFMGIELAALSAEQKLKQNSYNNASYNYNKTKVKYNSTPNSLQQLSAITTPFIRDEIKGEWAKKGLNIIITDWFETTDIVEVIKDLNRN